MLVAQGLINLLPTRALQVVNKASVAWNALGAVTVMALLPAVAQRHQSARFVFTSFQRDGVIVSDRSALSCLERLFAQSMVVTGKRLSAVQSP